MEAHYLQWIGYAASAIIALSMTMNSIVKFRWINLFGASTFAVYGLLIHAIPVALLNGFIVSVDIFYLIRIYSKKELFEILEIRSDNRYLIRFLEFHKKDIQKFFPGFTYKPELNTISFFILRNTNIAGIFLAHPENNDALVVGLDYVVPEYRDYKNGKFVYYNLKDEFLKSGYRKIISKGQSPKHARYLKKIGFVNTENDLYIKTLTEIE
ncbi:MAG: YgjV family protein [Chlorobi bacterium]|nr:YgjV family protein [Chlorobiota bacterium]